MKIVQLTAENVKRLKAVEITPDGTVQVIGGRNAQGKSSVLDAIWLALGGGPAAKDTARPIRDGETKASVTLDLGELKVTRTWTQSGTKLAVENADGARYQGPQGILDALVGKLAFDPLGFTRLDAKKQVQELLALVDLPIDLDDMAAQRKALYEQRAEIGRQGKALGDVPAVDETLPTEESSAIAVINMIESRRDRNREIESAKGDVEDGAALIKKLADEISRLQADLKEAQANQKKRIEKVNFLGNPEPTDELEQQLANLEESNAQVRANNAARAKAAEKARLLAEYKAFDAKIEALDKAKTDALAKAEFPVEGLSFDEDGVTFHGVPLSQASSAEQIRVSLAIAMALNPKLRVLRIADGSLLDEESMALIAETVKANDFQLWIERVGNADAGAVIIEDGQVAL